MGDRKVRRPENSGRRRRLGDPCQQCVSTKRLRSRSMVLTFRYTALRIGDVSMLGRERISKSGNAWRIFLRTEKNGKPIFLPVPEEMVKALHEVPTPRGVKGESKHFFWNCIDSPRSMKKNADDTLRAVFRKSEVKKAHAHRFRHTLDRDARQGREL